MALERTLMELQRDLHRLSDAARGLRVTVVEDKPLSEGAALVDALGDIADDVVGWVTGAQQAANEAMDAARPVPDVRRAQRALAACQADTNLVWQRYVNDLASCEHRQELRRLARERRGEWVPWVGGVNDAIFKLRMPLLDLNQTLLTCWTEMVDQAARLSVHIQNTLTA